jgi:cyanophycinase-like exopeptidase
MIALVGSGEYLPAMAAVDRSLLDSLGEAPRVVCLPTAAGRESAERITYWCELGVNHFRGLGANATALRVINRQDTQDASFAERVAAANFVYLSGGKPDYLLDTLKDSQVWKAILDVLGRGGVLAGCSAGAMVMGEWLPGFAGGKRAFGLLPGAVVIPHFDELPSWVAPLLRLWAGRGGRMVGIPGYTALAADHGTCKVLGKGSVSVWGRGEKRAYLPGDTVVWEGG